MESKETGEIKSLENNTGVADIFPMGPKVFGKVEPSTIDTQYILGTPNSGLYLVSPHGKWVFDGKKTLIVKSKRFTAHINEPLYLLEDHLCYGIISMEEPKEITPAEFRKLRPRHMITDQAAFQRWKWEKDRPLYSYEFKILERYTPPKIIDIPQGIQVFVDASHIKFKEVKSLSLEELSLYHEVAKHLELCSLHDEIVTDMEVRNIEHKIETLCDRSRELLIKDWKKYSVLQLIKTAGGRSILADDHRIVHTWWTNLQRGKAMKSPQFKDYSLTEQKRIVRMLHTRIIAAFKKLKWQHHSPLSGLSETLAEIDPSKIEQKDLEQIDDTYVMDLTDGQLKKLHDRLHWLYHNQLQKVTEPLQSAHIFVWNEMRARGVNHGDAKDKLDKDSILEVVEYPKPEGISAKPASGPTITMQEVLDAMPDMITLSEDPVHVYIVGRVVNEGKIPADHDIDILFKQGFPDARIIHEFLDQVKKKNPKIAERLHFVWDPWGPQIGYSVPIYRQAYAKTDKVTMARTHPFEYLSEDLSFIKIMRPYRGQKPQSGFGKNEFFDPQDMWNKWALENIDKGIMVQKKYDGMRFEIHVKGDQIKIFTEDNQRDRAHVFKKSVVELMKDRKEHEFIFDAEMVEYNCGGKQVNDLEHLCTAIKREEMIKWIGATKAPLDDENIVFHVHDCTWFNGQSLENIPYKERYATILKAIPEGMKHWRRVEPSPEVSSQKAFMVAINKARNIRGSEGAVVKVIDSKYSHSGRTSDFAKLKNLKEIDVMVWDVEQKKTKAGTPLQTWIYVSVFQVPCSMKDQIKPDYYVEYHGKCYAKIGRSYGSNVKCIRGDIITVRPIQIVESKDKNGKLYWAWMFPLFSMKRNDKNEPDTIDTVRKIAKMGTGAAKLATEEVKVLKLPTCPYWEDPNLCPLRERFYIPRDQLSKKTVEEYLKFPIVCKFANHYKCRFVKSYYYDYREADSLNDGYPLDEDTEEETLETLSGFITTPESVKVLEDIQKRKKIWNAWWWSTTQKEKSKILAGTLTPEDKKQINDEVKAIIVKDKESLLERAWDQSKAYLAFNEETQFYSFMESMAIDKAKSEMLRELVTKGNHDKFITIMKDVLPGESWINLFRWLDQRSDS